MKHEMIKLDCMSACNSHEAETAMSNGRIALVCLFRG